MNEKEMRARVEEIDARLPEARSELLKLADGDLGETEAARFDELETEHKTLTEERETLSARLAKIDNVRETARAATEAAEAAAAKAGNDDDSEHIRSAGGRGVESGGRSPEFMQRVDPWGDGVEVRSLTRREATDRALKVAELKELTRHLATDQLDQIDHLLRTSTPDRDASWIARMALLTEREEYRTGWMKLITQPTPVLTAEEAQAMNDVTQFRAMSGSVDTSGGFGVPVLIDPTIILTAQGSMNPFRRLARVETITTDAWNGVSSAGVTWAYSTEGAAYTDNAPTLAQPTVPVHEAKGFIPFSIRVSQDYPGFAEEMSRLLMEGYDELQANKFATGTGTNEPFGILTALAANTNVTVHVTTNGQLAGTDVNTAWGALPDRYKANATWVVNEGIANDLASLANNNNWSNFTVNLTGQVEQIRNHPVEFSSYFPSALTTATAANVLVVGDFRNYLIADRVGMTVELVPHLFTNNMPTSQRGWVAYARNGADSINDLGFRLLANS